MTRASEPWTKERIEALLASEDFRYQNVDLPYGLSTGGYDRSSTAEKIFPADLTGKSVLDIGSSFGYFCFEALRRGASRVVGLDVSPDSVRKARLLAEAKGAAAEFHVQDIEREPIKETFDYVLCLNVLHHLRNPIGALDDLAAVTRERLILEVAAIGRHDRRKLGLSFLSRFFLNRAPIMVATRSGTRGKREVQKFYITPSAIENMLMFQRGMFARYATVSSEHKGRFIVLADKRRIGHLLVVSSPTSAGKKTLMRRLVANEFPEIAQRIGPSDGSVWGTPLNANRIWEGDEPHREHVMLHHDFLRPYLRSTMTHERDEANDIFGTAGKVTFVTVWTPPERLVKQITEAEIDPRAAAGRKPDKRHMKIREEYRRPERVLEHYRRWFRYTATQGGDHIVVNFDGDSPRLMTPDEWEREVSGREASAT